MKKRIVFLTEHHWDVEFGGAEYQIKVLIDEITNLYDTFYLARNIPDKADNIKLLKIPYIKVLNRLGKSYFLDSVKVYGILRGINPDIIYQRVSCAYTGIAAFYANKYNKNMIWHVSSDKDVKPWEFNLKKQIIFDYIDRKIAEYGIRNCSKIIGQTKRQSKLLKEHYARKCDAIIPNFHPYASCEIKKENPIKISWVSNFKDIKRPELFVKVAKHFERFDNVRFYMVGRKQGKKHWPPIEDEIANIRNLVHLGERTLEEVNELFCQAHIFVNTSDFEGFPNTFIQAWMRRVPVVSLNVDPDNILKNYGIGFHSGSFEQLIKDTERLIEDKDLRETMGEKAQQYAIRNHSLANVEKIMELIVK
ncbi:MAG: glycosyltransferase family 4 protein [Deltaproteobacteria bacterium]|jgi:glycosyltransferase involved in cell wall biosynthesis|nr:glycosyltransferase family 4 protein [Deltaproteobacteria bacterium]